MIQEAVIDGFFNCPLKAYYFQKNTKPKKFDYFSEIKRFENNLKFLFIKERCFSKIEKKNAITIPPIIQIDGIEIKTPLLEYAQQNIIPVFISYDSNITKEKRHCFSYKTSLVARHLNLSIVSYKVVGINLKTRRFEVTQIVTSSDIINAVNKKQPIVKKKHCLMCV